MRRNAKLFLGMSGLMLIACIGCYKKSGSAYSAAASAKPASENVEPEVENGKEGGFVTSLNAASQVKIGDDESRPGNFFSDFIARLAQTKIRFDGNTAVITEDSQNDLRLLAQGLNEYSNVQLRISGHTDSKGDHHKNVELSRERAGSVKEYLVKYGINAHRLITFGYGATRPFRENRTEAGRKENRRVELSLK